MKQLTEEPESVSAPNDLMVNLPGETPFSLPENKEPPEMTAAKNLAQRYRLPYVDLLPLNGDSPIDYSLLGELPIDLMLRHQFVPLRREGKRLHIAMADPTDLEKLDELARALRFPERAPTLTGATEGLARDWSLPKTDPAASGRHGDAK